VPIKYKNVTKKEADYFICDKCKIEKSDQDISDGIQIKHSFGYHAPEGLDESSVDIILCEGCFSGILKREGLLTSQDTKLDNWDNVFKDLAISSACIFTDYSDEMIDNNINNGKEGVWSIKGIRHSTMVKANSARDALNKLDDYVGSWELNEISYLGINHPKVIKVI